MNLSEEPLLGHENFREPTSKEPQQICGVCCETRLQL
jgi:hypothetical protein